VQKIGYGKLVDQLHLNVGSLSRSAEISSAVNKRHDAADRISFPSGVAITDTIVGHIEFALRHEGVNLEVLDATFDKLDPALLVQRLQQSPNGDPIRRACFLWEWMRGEKLGAPVAPTCGYVDLFPSAHYVVAGNPIKDPRFRVNNNALGNPDFCPVVKIDAIANAGNVYALFEQIPGLINDPLDAALYARAVRYLYLSETRSSFAIEREVPDATKEERFVTLLAHAGEEDRVSEEWLVMLQNAVVKDDYSKEASYRTKQNWLENSAGQMTFLPPPAASLGRLMRGWEAFVNDSDRGIDLSVKIACAAFGFVYLHPFMDGNGRLHRFIIHHVLQRSGLLPAGVVLPVSASIAKNELAYLDVLSAFSRPVTRLWKYRRTDTDPIIDSTPQGRPYRYFSADREVGFVQQMIRETILTEIPNELHYLAGYDKAFSEINAALDIPRSDIGKLIRMIYGNAGTLSAGKRKQYAHLPDAVIGQIETLVRHAFSRSAPDLDRVDDDQAPARTTLPAERRS
jgi:hypothetical protein